MANFIDEYSGHVPGDDLPFALGQVERDPVCLADHRDQVDDERRGEHPEVPEVRLRVDDRGGGQRPRVEKTATNDKPIAIS